ncbi:MAG: 4-hydroxy-tetrahydrodipicolinate synthase [Planctomycetota bacterium]|jgi:4-hydroxy-tetrahydrodipicolinate synthase|nr:4-hydroxy-tetrahydrodipicolinate synthase [Planctomycetota bacterium]
MEFFGSYTALATPWTGDGSRIDYQALKDLVDWQIESGTDGLIAAGTTGESATMTHPEQEELIARVVGFAAGRRPVLAGAGSNNTAESTTLARVAASAGADALLVITPYYNRPTQEGLYRHFAAIAEVSPLPIMIYNVPSRTGVNLLPETVGRIHRDFPQVNLIKEASGDVHQIDLLLRTIPGVRVFSGDDSLTFPTLALGGAGVVSVIANLVPRENSLMVAAALAGDFAAAREWHRRLGPLTRACFLETNPGPVKAALRMMGKCSGRLRLPLVEPGPECEEAVRAALREIGLPG